MLGHIVPACVATSGVKGIYKIAHFSKYVFWSHCSAPELQSGYSCLDCREVFTLILQPLEEGQALERACRSMRYCYVLGQSENECHLFSALRTEFHGL